MNSYGSDQWVSAERDKNFKEFVEDRKITEQEFLEACAYRSYVHSYYGLKPFYPHWFDAAEYVKCLDTIKDIKINIIKRTPQRTNNPLGLYFLSLMIMVFLFTIIIYRCLGRSLLNFFFFFF